MSGVPERPFDHTKQPCLSRCGALVERCHASGSGTNRRFPQGARVRLVTHSYYRGPQRVSCSGYPLLTSRLLSRLFPACFARFTPPRAFGWHTQTATATAKSPDPKTGARSLSAQGKPTNPLRSQPRSGRRINARVRMAFDLTVLPVRNGEHPTTTPPGRAGAARCVRAPPGSV